MLICDGAGIKSVDFTVYTDNFLMQTSDIVTGSTERHLISVDACLLDGSEFQVHEQVVEPLRRLRAAASEAGFELTICSAFRSFERQLHIWNGKASGQRPILDSKGNSLNVEDLSSWDLVQAILRWSALPGASRHHWGTDFDIFDKRAMPEGYQIQLIPDEVQDGGLFAPMHDWLDSYFNTGQTHFYRPYGVDRGGVAPERWHISYRPVADQYACQLNRELLAERLQHSNILLLEVLLEHLDEIIERFILVD